MTHQSDLPLLVLHGVRILGFADTGRVAARFGLDEHDVSEELLDDQDRGWASRSSFGDDAGWSLTEAGMEEGERLLAAELDATGARAAIESAHATFLPLNDEVTSACTAVQLATDDTATASAVATLGRVADALVDVEHELTEQLYRFAGYHARFAQAVRQSATDPAWVTGVDRDSAHRVWFELHEDLLATLGLRR